MTLGWQGFQFEHPDDWALSRVTGSRPRGFLILSSAGNTSLQARWEPSGDPSIAARRYLDSLKEGHIDLSLGDEDVVWKRPGKSRGFARRLPSGRLFLGEVVGSDKLLPALRELRSTLDEGDLWSAYGLAVRVPPQYELEKSEFLSGHTKLTFSTRGGELTAERLGLAAQRLKEATLEEFAHGYPAFQLDPNRPATQSGSILTGHSRSLIHHEPELNQISVLSGRSRRLELLPEWAWFDRIASKRRN